KDQLIVMGIPDSVIFTEDRSNNTADNAAFAKQILDSLALKPPYLLITSAQHIPRASLLFKNAGVPTKPFPCSYIAGRSSFSFSSLIPQPSVLLTWDFYLKETLAYLIYKVKG
ncbi:MAG: YdcF family protein, partial [Bacteroidota bacterium]|nr:YdcF family protein [Bacteroidota bacterium]